MASPLLVFVTILALVTTSLATVHVNTSAINDHLTFDFYKSKCPNVENVIKDVMRRTTQKNPGWIPGILRAHFHDCFISGCDGSILLKPERYNSFGSELANPANNLRGLEAIDEMKAELEKQCPGVVSCTDILAYAARDAAVLAGNSYYRIPAGRRDGDLVDGSLASELPGGSFKTKDLIKVYAVRGLTPQDLVVLQAAHSIGRGRCSATVADDKNVENATGSGDILDKKFKAMVIDKYCPKYNESNYFLMLAQLNPETLDSAWGVQFYNSIMKGKAVMPVDIALAVYPGTKDLVRHYAANSALWMKKFGESMVKLSKVNTLTGEQGEIRRHCGHLNRVDMPAV